MIGRPAEVVVSLDEAELEWLREGQRFEVGLKDVGKRLGFKGVGATLHVVPAGKTAWPFHRHHVCDEMFVILSGAGTYRIGDKRLPITAGDCLGAPAAGEAHQIINSGTETLRYLAVSNHGSAEVVEFPDSGHVTFMARPALGGGGETVERHGLMTEVGYWDGEDTGESR